MNWDIFQTAKYKVYTAKADERAWDNLDVFAWDVSIFPEEDGTFQLVVTDGEMVKGFVRSRKTLSGAKRTAERMLRENWYPRDIEWDSDWTRWYR